MTPTILSQLWVNSRIDYALQPWCDNQFRRKTLTSNLLISVLKNDLVSNPVHVEGLGNYINTYANKTRKCLWSNGYHCRK